MHGGYPQRIAVSRCFCLVVALCACGLAQFAAAQEFTARIIAVLDGDTVLIRRGAGVQKIRLADIDAPEVGHAGMGGQTSKPQKAQAFGETAKRSLSEMVSGKEVRVVSRAVDVYGRMVARLNLNGLDVNAEQVRRGMAWAAVGWRQSRRVSSLAGNDSHDHGDKTLAALEAEARQASRGLWAQSDPTPPWDWRRQYPNIDRNPVVSPVRTSPVESTLSINPACSPRKHCSAMRSCEEARRYMQQCGGGTMDGDGDGVPCEKLCNGRQ